MPLEKGWSCERFLLFIVKKSSRKPTNYHRFNLNKVRSRSLYFQLKNKRFEYIAVRSFSTSIKKLRSDNSSSTDNSSLTVFSDADKSKLEILEFIKGKSGIYMWTNKLNGKKYVGSSVNLRRRLLEYYNVNRLMNEKSMPIYSSLLKHGYHEFSLTILEFCDINSLVSREKHFFDVHTPEYNILKTSCSPDRGSGWKH